ncbi:1399_t:CDS:2, partial [Acaulospora colombiana]
PENPMYHDREPEFPEFLEIKEIYDHRSEGIKLTGNILQRGELLNPDGPYRLEDYKWWISDDVDELFTVDLEDIAGRFYLMMPHVTKRTIARTHKNIND